MAFQKKDISSSLRKNRGETTQTTNQLLKDLLGFYLAGMSQTAALETELILYTWRGIVGPQIASMTKAHRFHKNILYVTVKNSTLLSILSSQHDKKTLIEKFMKSLPGIEVRDIIFRFG